MPDKKVNNDDLNSDKETNKSKDIAPKDKDPVEGTSKPDKKTGEQQEKKKEKQEAKDYGKQDNKDAKEEDSEKKPAAKKETKKPPVKKSSKDTPPDSNYQVSLVDENTLKIKIKTDKGVSLNSTVGGKNVLPEEVEGLLSKLGSGKDGEIEIEISINPEKKTAVTEENADEKVESKKEEGSLETFPGVLTPNPEVTNIVERKVPLEDEIVLTDEEILREKIGRKSPYNLAKQAYAQNFQIGLIAGVIIYLIAVFSFYSVASQDKIVEEGPQQRLIVLQDMPDPKIKLENIEDPNAPAKEEETEEDGTVPKRIPIKRNFNRPPIVKNPQSEDTDTNLTKDTTGFADTTIAKDTSTASGNPIPDSLMISYSGNEIGLIMNYPNNWKLVDSREINVNLKNFNGVVLSDTVAGKGTFNMFVKIDDEGKPFDRDKYRYPFVMNDSNMTTFSADPFELAGKIEYHFYLFGGKNNLSAYAVVDIDKFEKYKSAIEAVVKSISFAAPPQ
jgi:hypothetical protein